MVGTSVVLGLVLAGDVQARGMPAGSERRPLQVVVELTDLVGLPENALEYAKQHAATIFRAAGFSLTWARAPVDGVSRIDPAGDALVQVLVLGEAESEAICRRAGLASSAMGVAGANAAPGDLRTAWIFYHRVQRAALSAKVVTGTGLGQVIAHEIGHILLSQTGHSERGLMRADWNPADRAFHTFTPAEIARISARFSQPRHER